MGGSLTLHNVLSGRKRKENDLHFNDFSDPECILRDVEIKHYKFLFVKRSNSRTKNKSKLPRGKVMLRQWLEATSSYSWNSEKKLLSNR